MPTPSRFSLRFDSTERRGEEVPIPDSGLSIGRRAGNGLVISDPSVSGRHAELTVDEQGLLVRDLGSTNGTRVRGERVIEQRLVDGDVLTVGSVQLAIVDAEGAGPSLEEEAPVPFESARGGTERARAELSGAELSGAGRRAAGWTRPAEPAPAAAAPAEDQPAVERVRADLVERAGRSSKSTWLAAGVLVLALGGGAAWWLTRAGAGAALTPVVPVPGNLVAEGFSFEADRDAWEAGDGAPAAFLLSPMARRAGAQGLRAELAPGEWALHRSPAFRANAEREIRARANLRARGEAEGRLGIEFLAADGDDGGPAPMWAWGRTVTSADGEAEIALAAQVPPGYARARLALFARAPAESGGALDADDASAVEASAPARPAAAVSAAQLFLHGDPARSAHLARTGRVLLSGIEFAPRGAQPGRDGAPLAARADGPRIVLSAAQAGARELVLWAEAPLLARGVATIGPDGYRTHGASSEREAVTSILLGAEADLVEIELPGPSRVRGEREGSRLRLVAELGGMPCEVALQLDFSSERSAAEDLAHAARAAARSGELGAAIQRFGELLDRYPYESALVEEAEATRARLSAEGLAGLRAVRAEAERARYFGLAAMFEAARARALAIAQRFAGSEIASEADALSAELALEAETHARDEHMAERERLGQIRALLERRGAAGLAERVAAALRAIENPGQGGAGQGGPGQGGAGPAGGGQPGAAPGGGG